jgi:hypothetical protein
MITVVLPVSGDGRHAIREVPCEGGLGVRIERGDVQDTLLFRTATGVVRLGAIEMDADAAFVRRSAATSALLDVALWGPAARLTIDSMIFHAEDGAEFHGTEIGWSVRGNGRVVAAG